MLHSYSQDTFELGRQDTPQTGVKSMTAGTTRIDHRCYVDLIHRIRSLALSSSNLFINCVIFASVAIEDSIKCIPVLEVVGLVFSGQDSD